MRLQTVIGNLQSFEQDVATIEWIELDWEELNKRIIRKKTDQGREVAIVLDEQGLTYGDILFHEPGDCTIAVRTKLEPAYVIQPKSMYDMGRVSFELGNRHTPCIIENNEIIVRFDQTLEVIFHETGVPYVQTEKRFKQPFKYKGHHHHAEDTPAPSTHAHS